MSLSTAGFKDARYDNAYLSYAASKKQFKVQGANDLSTFKYFTGADTTTDVPATGWSVPSFNLVVAGGLNVNRIGRDIRIQRVQWQAALRSKNQNDKYGRVRLLTILDTQCNSTAPVLSTYIDNPGGTNWFYGHYNLNNQGRFSILDDRVVTILNSTWAGDAGGAFLQAAGFSFFNSKPCDIPITFSGPTGVITEVTTNNILFFAIAEHDLVIDLNMSWRVTFLG